ncbi:hypothetical protein H2248_011696 [Termitomyces sp. 'cryptogamus']|nr:hypothetical protein H2248_011696 [Termitomyces sp. 'cryptogamus']
MTRADSPILGFDGEHSDDPLRFPSPNFPPRDLCSPPRASVRNAVYLDDAAALFPRCVSVASSLDEYSENKIAALEHVRALYSSPSQVYVGPAAPTSSRWSTASSILAVPVRPPRRKRLTSLFARLLASASSTSIPEPREMHKAYLARDDPPIALDLRPPPVPPKSHVDLSLDTEPRRARLRQQQSMATLNSSISSGSSYASSLSLSTTTTSPPLSPVATPPNEKRHRGLKAILAFRPRSRVSSLVPPVPSSPRKRLSIRLSASTHVLLPPSPRGPPPPPPVPPKDTHFVRTLDQEEYARARGWGLDDRGRVLVGPQFGSLI